MVKLLDICFFGDFDNRVQFQVFGELGQFPQLTRVQKTRDEQYEIGSRLLCFENLIGINQEVFLQNRNADCAFHFREVAKAAAKIMLFGQNRNHRCARCLVSSRELCRIQLSNGACGKRRTFDLRKNMKAVAIEAERAVVLRNLNQRPTPGCHVRPLPLQ